MAALVNELLIRNPDAPFVNRTLDAGVDTLELDAIDTTFSNGANVVIDGNLTVLGTTTTVNSEVVNINDNYLYLNNGYTAEPPETGGIVINVDPDNAALVAVDTGGFTAGVPATSNPTVAVASHTAYAVGDYIQVSGTPNGVNDGIYEVLSDSGTLITIRGVGTTARVEDFTQNQFTTDATVQGSVVPVGLAVLRADTAGSFEQGFDTQTPMAFTPIGTGSVTLQTAYENGNTITTDAGNGDVIIAGTESLQVTATGGLDVDSVADFDVTQFDVDVTGAGFSLDSDTASNVTVTGGNLTLSTATSGDVDIASAGDVDVDGANIQLDATAAFSIDGAAASNVSVTGADLQLQTLTSGDVDIDAAGNFLVDATAFSLDATDPSNVTVAADGAGDDLTVEVTGATDSSLVLRSEGTGGDAIQLTATAGGIDVNTVTADAAAFTVSDGTNEYINVDSDTTNPKLDLDTFVNITDDGIGVIRTTSENIVAGDCLGFTSSGEWVRSDAQSGSLRNSVCYGISRGSFTASNPAQAYTVPGSVVPVRTVSALAASNNGRYLFVSATPGAADVTAPGGSASTRVIFLVGILLGADGVTTTPDVLLAPQFQSAGPGVAA